MSAGFSENPPIYDRPPAVPPLNVSDCLVVHQKQAMDTLVSFRLRHVVDQNPTGQVAGN
jgi:hypothetical protein